MAIEESDPFAFLYGGRSTDCLIAVWAIEPVQFLEGCALGVSGIGGGGEQQEGCGGE